MKKNGYTVYIARDGQEALDIIDQHTPDLILLDIMMPHVDGYQVCRHIKETEALSHIKVVFLSAKAKEADIQKGYDAGADLYLTKPFATKKLVEQVKQILN